METPMVFILHATWFHHQAHSWGSRHVNVCVHAHMHVGLNGATFWPYSCLKEFYCCIIPAPQSPGLLYMGVQICASQAHLAATMVSGRLSCHR